MPAAQNVPRPPAITRRRRFVPRLQITARTQFVPLAAAREVVDEASRWLGVLLPSRYAVRLAAQARIVDANSSSFRRILRGPGEPAHDRLYAYLRHWLAARLKKERPALFARLPVEYHVGAALPAVPRPWQPVLLSNDARLLAGF